MLIVIRLQLLDFLATHMSVPIRFIGNYDVTSEGKFLWEILTQLKNMGVGRYVTKTEWINKWPEEKSFVKIVKAIFI
jgi:hypothetical protein